MIPVIALVGRPNVGKSTLFNQLTGSRDALVGNLSGLTRDRIYGRGRKGDKAFIVIDTGGISGDERGIDSAMKEQSLAAIDEAHIIFFMVDAKDGLVSADNFIANLIRRHDKKNIFLVVNKVDGANADVVAAEFHELGFTHVRFIAAAHNRGLTSLMDEVLAPFDVIHEDDQKIHGIKIGVVGRPNVGKSTLVNRLLGEDRVVVYDEPGTTRDSIYVPYERHGKPYTLIDTAGVRKKGKVFEAVEKFSVIKTLQAIEDANVVILVLDARENIVEQDLHLLGFVLDAGRALVIAINKWDGMNSEQKDKIKSELDRRLVFVNFADIHFISALHGTNVGHLYESIDDAYHCATTRWPTKRLTEILEGAVAEHQPPMSGKFRIKLRYAHMGGLNPPIIVIHGTQTDRLPGAYKKYLENTYRKVLKLVGTPIHFEFKNSDNPYKDKRNTLTPLQLHKKKGVIKHIKKNK
jgi:GTP-binding protein